MRILVTEPVHEAGIAALEADFDVDVKLGLSPAGLLSEIGGYDAVVTRSGTAVTSALLQAGGERLKVVGRAGIGVDNIDIGAATMHRVAVVNAPNGNVRAAAEHTIALIFALARNVPQAHNLLHKGVWGKNHFMGCELSGKTLGIIGLGKVGTQVAKRAFGLEMEVIAYDPFLEQGCDVPLVPLDELLRQADFVTLHVPLTPITANMIGARELALMKESAYLVNCARGKVVDEAALYDACKAGAIAGAALDVFAQEPPVGNPLFDLENVILTPHLGGTTHEATLASALEVAAQVRAVLMQEYPTHVINPEALLPPAPAPVCSLNQWKPFSRVIFDCDSTLSYIEGINELAAMNGVPYEVAEMTSLAMGGQVAFETVFAERLDIIKPNKQQLAALGNLYVATLVEDAVPVAAALRFLGIEVCLVSGGYRDALLPLARKLGVPSSHLHANELFFADDGSYLGFDETNPLCRTGGKSEVLRSLPDAGASLFTGDGASDAEVLADVELFVGYGGVEKRGAVHDVAPVYLHAESLAPLLVMAAGMDGCIRLLNEPRFRPLVVKALSVLMREGTADYRPEYRSFFSRLKKFCMEGICN
ncbi:MAG: HAD-IB family phosphatase [Chloroflexota bacterium]|nr:HAD-IB family phosphatase [Chloroflexota bacterium]